LSENYYYEGQNKIASKSKGCG